MTIFKNEINKITNYLSNYMDVEKIKERYNACTYILAENVKQEIDICNKKEIVDLTKVEGLTVNPVYYVNKEYVLIDPTCFVNLNKVKKERLKQVIFHELMHVASTKNYIKDGNVYILKSGIYSKYLINYTMTTKVIDNKSIFLNEAMTELVAKIIYDDLYEEKYVIKERVENRIYKSGYIMPYTMLAYLTLNYFEENKDVLFEIYFNNNTKLFEKILKEKIGITLDTLNSRANECIRPTKSVIDGFDIYIQALRKTNVILNEDVRRQLEEV